MVPEPLEPPDYLPISMLNQLEYCERRFWLAFVQAETDVNAPMLEGIQQHERVHAGGTEREGDKMTLRRVYIWSDRLRLAGFADVVEIEGERLLPVEYKHGRLGRWLNDHVQLCAQALCLEERTGRNVERGAIFYWDSRRRLEVTFGPELRARTEAAVARAQEAAGWLRAIVDTINDAVIATDRDVRRLRMVYGRLRSFPGRDRFAFLIHEGSRQYQLEFPNDSTGISPQLVQKLAELVGEENIYIQPLRIH